MDLIELHILQSFPVTCLNRDDLGSPKSAIFGGVERARVSSQCWKRAIRLLAHEKMPSVFSGIRTKLIGSMISNIMFGEDTNKISFVSEMICDLLGKSKDGEMSTLLYLSPESLKNVVKAFLDKGVSDEDVKTYFDDDSKKKAIIKKYEPNMKNSVESFSKEVTDAADIALFGRMVANDPSQNVEGAAMFTHAISTHSVSSELDFFSAVDDEKKLDDSGAGHISSVEFNSACYYRYVGLNLDLLRSSKFFNNDEIKTVVSTFLQSVVEANPSARKNSMFGQTLPSYILGIRRKGQPIALANAFEKPIASTNGFVYESSLKLNKEWERIKHTFSISVTNESVLDIHDDNTKTMDMLISDLINNL